MQGQEAVRLSDISALLIDTGILFLHDDPMFC